MPTEMGRWLEALGLGEYAGLFAENGIDLEVLPHITEDELRELGLALGVRRKIQIRLAEDAKDEASAAAAPAPESSADAERRQVTVMFSDLVGSTALSATLDAEEYRDLLRSYQDACAGEIARYDGYVAQFLGDGVMAYFGWPRAHEDDVARAIQAGLDIIAAVRELLGPGLDAEPLAVRIGIATGRAVIGDLIGSGSAQQAAVTGETPNRAARVQHLVGSNEIAVDATTRALAAGQFACETLGRQTLKGIEGQCEVWRVVRERKVESRFAAQRGEELTPLVGRDEELQLLLRRWRKAKAGEGAAVLLSGEPGIGKSRLSRALEEAIGCDAHTRLLLQCSPRHENSALYPVIHQLELAACIVTDDAPSARWDKLEALLARAGPPKAETVSLVAALLSIEDERHTAAELTAPLRKSRTLDALVDHVAALSAQTPVLFVLEDAHWIDPTSMELLDRLIRRSRDLPVLVVVTYRPEFKAPWVGADHVTLLSLRRLSLQDRTRMAKELLIGSDLPFEAVGQIAERSDGVPLFLEELAQFAREARADDGSRPGGRLRIPTTLHDALEARLDRSSEVRTVAQVGAAIGREFGHGLVAEVVSLSAEELERAVAELIEAGLLLVRGQTPYARYKFRHALIQDTAYGTLLRSKRARLHARIAETLLGAPPEGEDVDPEVIAHHFTEAGDAARAIPLWREAGATATARSACLEAIAHLERALALVPELPEAERRPQTELELLMNLSPALIWVKGMASDEVEALNERALELAEATGDRERAFRARWASWNHAIQHPPMATAKRLAARLQRTSEETGESDHRIQAHHAQWTTSFFLGELEACHRHATACGELYDPEVHGHHTQVFGGHDPAVCALGFGSLALWAMGRTEQAIRVSERSCALADAVGHEVSKGLACCWAALCQMLVGEMEKARAAANSAVEIAERLGLVFTVPYTQLARLVDAAGRPGEPADPESLELCRKPSAAGMEVLRPYLLAHYAGIQAEVGRGEEAMSLLDHACRIVAPFESHWCQAELMRLRGELLRQFERDDGRAEICFREALQIAERQGARAWSLRTATSLARLMADRGNPRRGRELLAPIYEGIAEGFDTPDFRAAGALLDALA